MQEDNSKLYSPDFLCIDEENVAFPVSLNITLTRNGHNKLVEFLHSLDKKGDILDTFEARTFS